MNCPCCTNPLHPFHSSFVGGGHVVLTHVPHHGDEVCVNKGCSEFLAQRQHSPRREGDEREWLAA